MLDLLASVYFEPEEPSEWTLVVLAVWLVATVVAAAHRNWRLFFSALVLVSGALLAVTSGLSSYR